MHSLNYRWKHPCVTCQNFTEYYEHGKASKLVMNGCISNYTQAQHTHLMEEADWQLGHLLSILRNPPFTHVSRRKHDQHYSLT